MSNHIGLSTLSRELGLIEKWLLFSKSAHETNSESDEKHLSLEKSFEMQASVICEVFVLKIFRFRFYTVQEQLRVEESRVTFFTYSDNIIELGERFEKKWFKGPLQKLWFKLDHLN